MEKCSDILPMVLMHTHQSMLIILQRLVAALEEMVGEKMSDFSIKKKDHAVTMGSKNGVKVDGEIVQFEPDILFQKLAVATERTDSMDPESMN